MRDAAFDALAVLDHREHLDGLRAHARTRGARAVDDLELAASVPGDGEAAELLRAALRERGRADAIAALTAVALMSPDPQVLRTATENLHGTDAGQLANALETLETSEHRTLVRPLLALWEETAVAMPRPDWADAVSRDPDPFIRACADLIRTDPGGDPMARTRTSMSPMERVLVLRPIPLFAELPAADLLSVADIAEEQAFVDGDVIAVEGELGDELHIVLSGSVAVVRGDVRTQTPIAHRGAGEVVGEMSIITRDPRVASLVAEGEVRTLRIGHREFESMLRERPDVALAVMRVLARRLGAEAAADRS